jgi:hypothetical protein
MTAQHDAAASALAEVRRQQTKIRRFVGNGWFEITFVGVALLAAFALSQLVHGTLPTVAVFAGCLAPYYVAVYWRHRAITRDLGFTSEPVWVANTISAVTAALCLAAGIALRGDAAVLTVDGVAATCCVVFAVMYRTWLLAALAAVDVGAGIFSALTSDGGWLPDIVVCGGALVILGAVLLLRVQRDG